MCVCVCVCTPALLTSTNRKAVSLNLLPLHTLSLPISRCLPAQYKFAPFISVLAYIVHCTPCPSLCRAAAPCAAQAWAGGAYFSSDTSSPSSLESEVRPSLLTLSARRRSDAPSPSDTICTTSAPSSGSRSYAHAGWERGQRNQQGEYGCSIGGGKRAGEGWREQHTHTLTHTNTHIHISYTH